MAEDNTKDTSSIRYVQGLFKDTSHLDQPAGTIRYAKNAIINRAYGSFSNEEGNTLMASLPDYSTVIGTINCTDNALVIFIRVENPLLPADTTCQIGLYTEGLYATLLTVPEEDPDPAFFRPGRTLNFQKSNPIEGTFVEQIDGDDIVYWTDDLNPPRTLNIRRQQESGITQIYSTAITTDNFRSYINILDLFPHSGRVPHVELDSVNMGGALKSGTYYLALAYTDDDNTTTDFITVANPVSIVPATEGIYPIESYDGAPADIPTGKSISWTVSNINTNYRYITPAVIYNTGEGKKARKLVDLEIKDRGQFNIVYSGDENTELFSVEKIVVGTAKYETAKTISQLDGVLYLGNLKNRKALGYQKYANFIKLASVVKEFNPFDPYVLSTNNLMNKITGPSNSRDQGYRDDVNIFKNKGYTREEVYAFYISFILRDGSMSEAYHIPGRAPMEGVPVIQVPELYNQDYWNPIPGYVNEADLINTQGGTDYFAMNITGGAWTGELLSHFFHWYDFSAVSNSNLNSRQMNYWHNLNEFYPNSEDSDVVDAASPSTLYTSLRDTNVRHHRFPSNLNEERTTVVSDNTQEMIQENTKQKRVWYFYYANKVNHDLEPGGINYEVKGFFQASTDCQSGVDAHNWAVDTVGISLMDNGFNAPSIVGDNMCTVSDISCFPPNHEYFRDPNCLGASCTPELIEFRAAQTIPEVGTKVYLGWNGRDATLWSNDACDMVGVGYVVESNGPDQLWINDNWFSDNTLTCVPETRRGLFEPATPPSPAFVVWEECVTGIDANAAVRLEHTVQPLGFKLSDVKVPEDIWNQTQGFRIYHAKRSHEDRTVLGQNPIHPMASLAGVETAHCKGFDDSALTGDFVSGESEFIMGAGIPIPRRPEWFVDGYSFHDFYLLNGKKDISSATHIKIQYALSMMQWKGNVKYYEDELFADSDLGSTGTPICLEPVSYTAFFASGKHARMPFYHLNYIIQDKAKSYIPGGQWLKSKNLGFGKEIYNKGGETFIGLQFTQAPPFTFSRPTDPGYASWNYDLYQTDPVDGEDMQWNGYTEGNPLLQWASEGDNTGLQYLLVNLKAFKTNVYNSFDKQDLIWTGFEVIGEDYNNFKVGNPVSNTAPNYTTEDIYGGDTFICRHGYRITSRLEARFNSGGFPASRDLKSGFFTIVETTDNINFRHIENYDSTYFPGDSAGTLLDIKADIDLTNAPDMTTGNMKYNEAYSEVNDIKGVVPNSITTNTVESLPARVIRSDKLQRDSLIDTYRVFQFDQYRELPTHKGELWKLVAAENLMFFQMEDTLYKTKGKQTMQLGDGSSAYVGSGDIFAQDPDEIVMADTGYVGTRAQRASVVTPYGYFTVDIKTRKVFLVAKATPLDLTTEEYGMKRWFQTNIPFALEEYGFDGLIDSPITGMGLHAVWDERYNRILLTKRDLKPTELFISSYKGVFETTGRLGLMEHPAGSIGFVDGSYYILQETESVLLGVTTTQITPTLLTLDPDSGDVLSSRLFDRTGWTVSFTVSRNGNKMGMWTSFHDYIPYIYSTVGIDFYSFVQGVSTSVDKGIYRHDRGSHFGKFYNQTPSRFEVEIVHNVQRGRNKLFYSLNWLADVFEPQASGGRDIKDFNAGFTSYIVYNSDANSGEIPLEYMINTRKTGGSWKVNQFRDMSQEVSDTSIYYTGSPFTGGNYGITGVTVAGTVTTSVTTAAPLSMFIVDGMNETFNTDYIDPAKLWNNQGKFIDRFLAMRLICNNLDNNLINLYNTESPFRIQDR